MKKLLVFLISSMFLLTACEKEIKESGLPQESIALSEDDKNQLESSINAFFNTKYEFLTKKKSNLRLDANNSTNKVLLEVQEKSQAENSKLAKYDVFYDDFKTEVSLEKSGITKSGRTLEVPVTETTHLNIRGEQDKFTTGLKDDYIFTFTKVKDKWIISDFKRKTLEDYYINQIVPDSVELIPQEYNYNLENGTFKSNNSAHKNLGSYNGTAAANYAKQYALNYNSNYTTYGQDCTNFMSQATSAGGWSEVLGFYRSYSAWWYNTGSGWPQNSFTWSAAHNFAIFSCCRANRSSWANSWSQASLGDIVMFDFNDDYHIDHLMMVTHISANGTIYVSGHTNDRRNYPITNYFGNGYGFYLGLL